jgi:hypothetical protein
VRRYFHAHRPDDTSLVVAGYISLGIAIAAIVTHAYALAMALALLSIGLLVASQRRDS